MRQHEGFPLSLGTYVEARSGVRAVLDPTTVSISSATGVDHRLGLDAATGICIKSDQDLQ